MGLLPDFVLDYVTETTFWTILLIVHGLLAVALLGAITHQAMSVLMPVRRVAGAAGEPGIVTRFRSVQGAGYAAAVCVLWIVIYIFGSWLYTKFRMYVRIPIEAQGFWKTQGVFELKEHVASIGLGLLPIYYLNCAMLNSPLFTYHPSTNRVDWLFAPPVRDQGPAMHYYGWTTNMLIGSAILGVLATFLPERLTRTIPLSLTWIVPVAAVPILIYALRFFWRW